MNRRIKKSRQVRQDLVDLFVFIGRNNLGAARRFLEAAERTFRQLLTIPGLGNPWEINNPSLMGLRVWPVQKFENYLIFFRPTVDGIEIVRVLHGARDLESIFQ